MVRKGEILHTPTGWVVDKRISLPTLVLFGAYALSAAWYMSKQDSRIETNEKNIVRIEDKAQKALDKSATTEARIVRIETLVEVTSAAVGRIEKKLEK